jgi:hypothetical protein
MAELTTNREFRCFILDHIQPYVIMENLKMPVIIRDEYDNFQEEVKDTVNFQPPGTEWFAGIGTKLWAGL